MSCENKLTVRLSGTTKLTVRERTGLAGRELEIRMNDNEVLQARYVGEPDTAWRDLADFSIVDGGMFGNQTQNQT